MNVPESSHPPCALKPALTYYYFYEIDNATPINTS